jgi:hypothetical protein
MPAACSVVLHADGHVDAVLCVGVYRANAAVKTLHNKSPIFGSPEPSSIAGATLEVTVNGTVQNATSEPFTLVSQFVFEHDETPNLDDVDDCDPQESDTPCDDIVTLVSSTSTGGMIKLGDKTVFLAITGFRLDGGTFTDFLTEEGQSNEAFLEAEFRSITVPVIPTPAPLLLIAAGLF